jgi:hypothetical protein
MAETIEAAEYQEFMTLRDQIEAGIENATSEFMLTTYQKLRSVMNHRQLAANKLNIVLKNQKIRETAKQKREALRANRPQKTA